MNSRCPCSGRSESDVTVRVRVVPSRAVAGLNDGKAAFVPAGAVHRFTGYEGLCLLVVFARPHEPVPEATREARRLPHPV